MITPKQINDLMWEVQNQYEIVAQDGDIGCDYEASGWVIIRDLKEDRYAMGSYSHCSCYGTWSSQGMGDGWDWEGTKEELIALATGKFDPNMPDRIADPEDYDYDRLMSVYQEVLLEASND